MITRRRYQTGWRWTIGCMTGLLLITLLPSCNRDDAGKGVSKPLNRRLSLRRTDDIPYGGRIAYEGLSYIFPDAEISYASKGPSLFTGSDDKKIVIALGTSIEVQPADVTSMINFVGDGNQVFLSGRSISDTLLRVLGMRVAHRFSFISGENMDSLTVGVYSPVNGAYHRFSYPGDSYDTYVTKLDTQYTSVLGRDQEGHPNFVRINYKGGGAIFLHFAPLTFSNFFLLHKQNMEYYSNILSYLKPTVKEVIWDDYYRVSHSNKNFSALQYIFSKESLRWAFWLLLLLFALVYIFDSKRRQRLIPVILPLKNTSLDFVKTIGQLYYQRRDNRNLATKMAVHFQDQVRTRYHVPVATLDEEFVSRLAYRTGYAKERLQELTAYIRELPSKANVPDEELLRFHQQLEAFYKHI